MSRIGIYGGSFNPIHAGHVHILREFIARLELDRALLIPAGVPPHKENHDMAPGEDRLAMCRLAASEFPPGQVEVCRWEIDQAGKSYTVNTLAMLRQQYPQDDFFLLMGEDMFLTVDHWYHAEEIMAMATLCGSARSPGGHARLLEKERELAAQGARCRVEEIPVLEVSSTQIRQMLRRGESPAGLVPDAVLDYLRQHPLYRPEGRYAALEEEARRLLTPARFIHSQCVADCAASLARQYGADPEKARVAGILHDIMKDTPGEEQLKIIGEAGIILDDAQKRMPKLWHAIAGACYARLRLGIQDEEILGAIRWHTSGRGGMSLLEKVLFVADYISADREYPSVDKMRQASERSLEETIIRGVAYTLWELTDRCSPLDADSLAAYNEALQALPPEVLEGMKGHSREFIGDN